MITDPTELALIDFALSLPGARTDVQFPVQKGNSTVTMWFSQRVFMIAIHAGDRVPTDGGGYVLRTVDLEQATGWDQWVWVPPEPKSEVERLSFELGRRVGRLRGRLATPRRRRG